MNESDEICVCGHSKGLHYQGEGPEGHCVLACECEGFRPREEKKKMDEICVCGHPVREHAIEWCNHDCCSCTHYKKVKEEEKPEPGRCTRCGHLEEEHYRFAAEGIVLRHCRVMGCSCEHFTEEPQESLWDFYRRISGGAPRPRVVFARFQARQATDEGWYEFFWLVNPEDVSSVMTTGDVEYSLISMKNGTENQVFGTIAAVEKKLREAS